MLHEELLDAWLRISTSVINSRIVSGLSYKEALVCNILYRNKERQDSSPLTATELCTRTGMLKSQMNRTLNHLEEKGLVIRQRSDTDRRQINVLFNILCAGLYEEQHIHILKILDAMIDKLGEKKTREIIADLHLLAQTAGDILNEPRRTV